MFTDRKKPSTGKIETLIGAGTVIEGDVRFKGGLQIDGAVVGRVLADEGSPGMVVLSENARIEGEVRAAHVVVNGAIVGPVHAEELLELQSRARLTGDVRYRALEMHHGAVVDGSLAHLEDDRPGLKLAANNE